VKPCARWRPVVVGGLACLVTILALLSAMRQLRQVDSPRVQVAGVPPGATAQVGPGIPSRSLAPPPAGPPMRIDPAELSRAGRERDDNGLGMRFCWCPPGVFHMGMLPDRLRRYREITPVTVTLGRGFWMGKFEVTQDQWRRVMRVSLSEQRAKDPTQPRPVGDNTMRDHVGEGPAYPIYYTSHAEAEEFCRKLTESERAAGRLEQGWEYRLPTEAQWEFACRAGTTTATASGDPLGSTQANFDGTHPFDGAAAGPYLRETTPVGQFPANGWGLHDMHGNVWEWCRDGFTATPGGGTDPVEEPSSSRRTFRGGCWHNLGTQCLSTARGWGERSSRGSGLGFRVALVPTGS
jgi:formylglycine-generating enzyme